jgi:hypothetical protein
MAQIHGAGKSAIYYYAGFPATGKRLEGDSAEDGAVSACDSRVLVGVFRIKVENFTDQGKFDFLVFV